MVPTTLTLKHFRNYTEKTYTISPTLTVIVGENAHGKTNILEALFLLSTGESFRAQKTEEMIEIGYEVGRAVATLTEGEHEETLEAIVTNGKVQGTACLKRQYKVDNTPKRKKDAIGKFSCVLFRPEDMNLISGSPGTRRKFLDTALSQIDRTYRESLDSYEKALKRRNALLDLLRERKTNRDAFTFWDQLLIKHGNVLTKKRRDFLVFLEKLNIFPFSLRIEYDSSSISEKRLKQYEQEEVMCGYTLVGPHKDDFRVYQKNGEGEKNLALYGSRGQQRMGVLWLKLGELAYYEDQKLNKPLLLLDDIFSELDQKHQEMVLSVVFNQQTIITTTPEHLDLFSHMKFDMLKV